MKTMLVFLVAASLAGAADWQSAPAKDWISLFNGKNLDGWVVKFAGHELGDNYGDTFRVENGLIRVMYDKYPDGFGARFGHLFWRQKLSHYVLSLEYRFFGEQVERWAVLCEAEQRRDGALASAREHSQGSGLADQCGGPVPCRRTHHDERLHARHRDPHEWRNGEGTLHELEIESLSKTIEWVKVEVEVLGGDRVRHWIVGENVLEYEKPMIGGGVANRYDPAIKEDGKVLTEGYIGLQAESQPVEFRNVRLLNLAGCMVKKSPAYREYFVHRDDSKCSR